MDKPTTYRQLYAQIAALIKDEDDTISALANTCAAIHTAFGFWWTGFYLWRGDSLHLGPFQGPVACTRIAAGRGVCGTAYQQGETIIVPNVKEFPGHIACSSLSRSEIVVPVKDTDGNVKAVIDIDSRKLAAFDDTDRTHLERIAGLISHII